MYFVNSKKKQKSSRQSALLLRYYSPASAPANAPKSWKAYCTAVNSSSVSVTVPSCGVKLTATVVESSAKPSADALSPSVFSREARVCAVLNFML